MLPATSAHIQFAAAVLEHLAYLFHALERAAPAERKARAPALHVLPGRTIGVRTGEVSVWISPMRSKPKRS